MRRHDALGRVSARTQTRGSAAARSDAFGYNARSELTSATLGSDEYAYAFDYIGNRGAATEAGIQFVYTTNNLNQYTSRGEAAFLPLPENPSESDSEQSDRNVASPLTFSPTYDLDGNATLVRTSTGTWQITYNGENRPIRFEKKVTVAGTPRPRKRFSATSWDATPTRARSSPATASRTDASGGAARRSRGAPFRAVFRGKRSRFSARKNFFENFQPFV